MGLPASIVAKLPWIEDGTHEISASTWDFMRERAQQVLERKLAAHIHAGLDWRDLRLGYWPVSQIEAAAKTAQAMLEIGWVPGQGYR